MNCQRFQELMFEYLEGSLSPAVSESAAAHVSDCPVCRAAVQQQQQFARSISTGLRQSIEALTLRPDAHRRLMDALREDRPVPAGGDGALSWWRSLVWPATVSAAIVLAAALMIGVPFGSRVPVAQTAQLARHDAETSLSIRLSYCAPIYSFHQEGDLVIDYVTCDPRYVDETLRVYRK
jgi:anti-sigma factor RsiW